MIEVSPDRIVDLGFAFRGAKVLMAAVELDVFTALSDKSSTAEELQAKLCIHARGARDFFDALAALGLLQRDHDGRYLNAPDADFYLDRAKATYIGGFIENLNAREYGMWSSLTAALRSGQAQTGFEEKSYYTALFSDPRRLNFFVKAMAGWTLPVAQTLAAKFPWRDYSTIADIGTGQGCLPLAIAKAHPHITGVGLDLPVLQPIFEAYVREHNNSAQLRFHAADFFSDPFPRADVLVLGRVLHNWDLPTKRMLLGKAHEALSEGGALIVYEWLIDDERRASSGLLSSLNMLIMTAGGFDFSGNDCVGWMREIGFRDMRIEALAAGQSMVVGVK